MSAMPVSLGAVGGLALLLAGARGQQEASASVEPAHHLRVTPPPPSFYVTDLVPASAQWHGEAIRKTGHHEVTCHHKTDHLSSAADLVSGFAKILLAVAAILFIKLLIAKMFLLPAKLLFLAKIGIKSFLLYPFISKMVKLWKKKKKNVYSKEAGGIDEEGCPALAACVLRNAARGTWRAQLAATLGLALDDDPAVDSSYLLTLLQLVSPADVAACAHYDCDDVFAL